MSVDDEEMEAFAKKYDFTTEGSHTIRFFVNKATTNMGKDIFRNVPNISKVSFDDCCELPNLTVLSATCSYIQSTNCKIDIHGFKGIKFTGFPSAFTHTYLESVDTQYLDTSNATNLLRMFWSNTKLRSVDVSKWDVSKVKTFTGLFADCSQLTYIGDISNWNVNATAISTMFNNCENLTWIGDLSNWNISSATSLGYLFNSCAKVPYLGDLTNWDVSNIKSLYATFDACSSLTYIGDFTQWNVTSACTSMFATFNNCTNLTHIGDLSNWDTSLVTTMCRAFFGLTSLTEIGLPLIPEGCNTDYLMNSCPNLTTITTAGTISESVYIADSPLTPASVRILVDALDDAVSSKKIQLSSDAKNNCIAAGTWSDLYNDIVSKGWTVLIH